MLRNGKPWTFEPLNVFNYRYKNPESEKQDNAPYGNGRWRREDTVTFTMDSKTQGTHIRITVEMDSPPYSDKDIRETAFEIVCKEFGLIYGETIDKKVHHSMQTMGNCRDEPHEVLWAPIQYKITKTEIFKTTWENLCYVGTL